MGDIARVIDWVLRQLAVEVGSVESAIWRFPRTEDLDLNGIDVPQADLDDLFAFAYRSSPPEQAGDSRARGSHVSPGGWVGTTGFRMPESRVRWEVALSSSMDVDAAARHRRGREEAACKSRS